MLRKFSSFFMGDSCPSFSKTVPSSTRHTSAMADDEQGAAAALPGQIVRTCHAANCLRPSVDDSLRSLFCRPCDADRLDYCNRYHCLPELWASWAESHVNFPESARQHLRTFIAVKQILFFPKMLEYRRYSSQRFFGGPDHGHLQYELHMQEVIDRHPTETSEVSELEQLAGGGAPVHGNAVSVLQLCRVQRANQPRVGKIWHTGCYVEPKIPRHAQETLPTPQRAAGLGRCSVFNGET